MNPSANRRPGPQRFPRSSATLACAIGSLLCAWALADGNPPEAQAAYQRQVAACNSGKSVQDKATCLKEAGAAREAAAKNQLGGPATSDSYKQNALQRCRALPDADRKDCEARIDGAGTTSGSVGQGGILREMKTQTVPGAASAPASQP